MELSVSSQIVQLLDKANICAILLPENLSADCLASGGALKRYLEKSGKQVRIMSAGTVPDELSFLPEATSIAGSSALSGVLSVVLDTSTKKLSELSYDTKDNKVSILLKASQGVFAPSDISFETAYGGLDLVFILGAQNPDQLGQVFTDQAELFYEVPKINIDVHPDNEYFGTVNVVDVTAVSITEVLAEVFDQLQLVPVDAEIATGLLTGIIEATNSFQAVTTTPRAFSRASELIGQGARQQDIIQKLFKTKELPLLKLWGRALARLKTFDERGFCYTVLGQADFDKTATSLGYIPKVLQEFIDNVAGFKVFGVVSEFAGGTESWLTLHPQLDTKVLFEKLGISPVQPLRLSGGGKFLKLSGFQGLQAAEERVASAVLAAMPSR